MIKWLRLVNFKCFEDQSLWCAPLTILSGLNGMGKSTVLQSLLLLRQSYQQGTLSKDGLALNGDLLCIGNAKDALFEGAQEDSIAFEIGLDNGVEASWAFKYDSKADVMALSSSPSISDIFRSSLFNDDFQYLQSERIGPRVFYGTSDYLVRQHKQLGKQGEYTAHFLSLFGNSDISCPSAKHPDESIVKLKAQVEAWLSEVSPGIHIEFTENVRLDVIDLQYSFVADNTPATNPYRATNVGFGITYLLPVLVAILSSSPGSLILIENPEAHLHPRGQVKVGELLARAASCGVQILVETHSDHVLNGMRIAVHDRLVAPEMVVAHFFERNTRDQHGYTSVTSPRISEDGRFDYIPEGFFDEWDRSLDALLRSRGI